MLLFAVWQNMPLLGNPPLGAFEPTGTAGFGFTDRFDKKNRECVHSGEEQQYLLSKLCNSAFTCH
nr:hypothetical protein [Providencia sp.]UNJ80111.1 hypothetical protein [Providencia sp.]